jgi:glycosyltransferase involved in cell wall biosynthesis
MSRSASTSHAPVKARTDGPLKILLCHNYYQLPGGEDRVFEDEARLLEQRGHQVIRFTRSNDSINTMSRWKVATQTIWNRDVYAELRDLIRHERPSIMHCTNTFPLISPAAYYAANAEQVPVVQALQNYRLICPGALLMRDGRVCEDCVGKKVAWPAILHGCYRGSRLGSACVTTMLASHRAVKTWRNSVSCYVVPTEFSRRKFVEAGFDEAQIAVKPNFVDPSPSPGAGAGGYFVFVGRLAEEKGLKTLLDAWSGFRGKLKILGDGPLAGLVAEFASRDASIEWLGQQPGDVVQQVVGDSVALVVPSIWYEGLPKTIIEAFSVGTPIIASNLGAMSEVIEPGKTGLLFQPGNTEQLLEALSWAADSPQRMKSMRTTVRETFERRYTADRNYELLLDIYRRVLAEHVAKDCVPHS